MDRPATLRRHADQLAVSAGRCTTLLAGIQLASLQVPAPPERPHTAPVGRSDPSADQLVNAEAYAQALWSRFHDTLQDVTVAAAQHLDLPPVADRQPPTPATMAWHAQTVAVGDRLTDLVTLLVDRWPALEADCWQRLDGIDILDPMADLQLTQTVEAIRHAAGRVRTIQRRLQPGGAQQPELVWCQHHPDRLARYRTAKLCGACYQAEWRLTAG